MTLEQTANEPEVIDDGLQTEETAAETEAEAVSVEESADSEKPTEEAQEPAETPLLRDIRKMLREEKKRARQLEQELQTLKAPKSDDAYLGPKPTLEDVDYDAQAYGEKLEAWLDRKAKIDAKVRQQQEEQEKANRSWQEKVNAYTEAKKELPPDEIEDAEDIVQTLFNPTQQGIMLNGLGAGAAKLVVELGKNTVKAKALSEIRDPVEFAIAIGEMKASMNTGNKRTAPPPEKPLSGGSKSPGGSSKLEELRAEAQKTGNFDKYLAYKRSMQK